MIADTQVHYFINVVGCIIIDIQVKYLINYVTGIT